MNTINQTLRKRLFVLRVNNFRPELCEFTIPTIKYWCLLNGWEYKEISRRAFPDMPITAEKLQIHEIGRLSDWNCICDADLLLRPDFKDPSVWGGSHTVRSSYHFSASQKFVMNKYFERDGRDLGLSGGFIMAHRICHEVWEPPTSWLHALTQTHNKHLIDEYIISRNLAKYGLHYDGVSNDVDKYIVHFGDADIKDEQKKKDLVRAKELYLDWLEIWPSIANLSHEPL